MDAELKIEVVQADQLSHDLKHEIHTLCNQAFEEDLGPLFETFKGAVHVLGFLGLALVSHALLVLTSKSPEL